jgi:general secretion pathway protein A
MYSQFFGFDKLPFRLRPDPDFLYPGREFHRARSGLIASLQGSARLTLFIGPPGVGKTLLLDDVLPTLGEQFAFCRINQPHISAAELLQAIMLQLVARPDLAPDAITTSEEALSATLEPAGKLRAPALLIIDDAQMLPSNTLLAIPRILAKTRRLKILLIARQDLRPDGDDLLLRLSSADKPQIIRLDPLTADGVKAYIEHRLRLAGGAGKDIFTPDAFAVIYQHTAGSPRLINLLCDAALHAACTRASGHVSAAEIVVASQDPHWPEALARDRAPVVVDEAISAPSVAMAPREPADCGDDTQLQAPATASSALGVDPAAPLAETLPTELPTSSAQQASSGTPAQFIISYRKQSRAWPLAEGRTSIGRAADNVLCLEAPEISRHHCEVIVSADVAVIKDLGSVNGIIVNGKLVKRYVLKHADVVRLGEHVLRYERS